MALPTVNFGRGTCSVVSQRVMLVLTVLVLGMVFPALALFGGSTNLINWGPGLLFAGAACLLLLDKDWHLQRGGMIYACSYLVVLGLLFLRARHSLDVSAAANNSALIALAAGGYLIGSLAGVTKSRALFTGLSLVMLLNLFSTVMQKTDPHWNLIYPERSAGLPSGLFAHYSYSAAFCLGALGLLTYRACNERSWLRGVMIVGAVCALVTIPFTPSRGGNLALALMVATAGALLLARAFSKSRPVLGIWLPAAALVALVLIFAAAFVPLIDRGGQHGFYNDGVRLAYWNAAAQLAAGHPWLGGGAGSFATNVYQVLDDLTTEPAMVHNEALQLAVGYGFPALVAITVLMLVPLLLSCWRFVNQTDRTLVAMAALGLVAMLFQSNFESIFHCAPGAFIAALILGRLSRSLWGGEPDCADQSTHEKAGGGQAKIVFLTEIKTLADAHAGGSSEAVSKLAGLLSQSKDEPWRRGVLRLSYWAKVDNEESLDNAVRNLGLRAAEELGHLSGETPASIKNHNVSQDPRYWGLTRSLMLAAVAISILYSGSRLSAALRDAWGPLYRSDRMTVSDGFERLIGLAESHSGLGLDRQVLSAAWDSLHQYQSQAERESWANKHRTRLLFAIRGWRTDPGAALQIAEIVGWAGDFDSALKFYDQAIATQGSNEALFMAYTFKGQYFHELFISARAAGQIERQRFFAGQAVEAFKLAEQTMGGTRRLARGFEHMNQECQDSLEPKT